jgi:ABC-type oligopeptide transport system substrate-binding subunit
MTWTFRLRTDTRYAPPLADRTIRAEDFITAAEHSVRVGDSPFFDDIVGVREFRDGSADSISGIQAPDPGTLVIHLTRPAGDLGNRVALADFAPIPAEALAGREDSEYAGFLVSSGPYMYEHAPELDLADPAAPPIWELDDDTGPVVLVRNPSWNGQGDPLRPAWVDRIELSVVDSLEAAVELIDAGRVDVIAEPSPAGDVQRYLASETLRARAYVQSALRTSYVAMNLAIPPFDDVNVRRAVNLVIDRGAVASAITEAEDALTVVAQHTLPDALENNLLLGYRPYAETDVGGDLEAAREAMRQSRYDTDGDGRCDADVCRQVSAPGIEDWPPAALIRGALARIGMRLVPDDGDPFLPTSHHALITRIGWGADYPSASNFGLLFSSAGLNEEGSANLSMLGATPEQLERWNYRVTDVPSVDEQVDSCSASVGSDAFLCWAELDQVLMERVIPWAPLVFQANGWLMSDRVAAFSVAADTIVPALDQIQLVPEP